MIFLFENKNLRSVKVSWKNATSVTYWLKDVTVQHVESYLDILATRWGMNKQLLCFCLFSPVNFMDAPFRVLDLQTTMYDVTWIPPFTVESLKIIDSKSFPGGYSLDQWECFFWIIQLFQGNPRWWRYDQFSNPRWWDLIAKATEMSWATDESTRSRSNHILIKSGGLWSG